MLKINGKQIDLKTVYPDIPSVTNKLKILALENGVIKWITQSRPIIISSQSISTKVGQSFSYFIEALNPVTSYTAFGLPLGTIINNSTGEISGTINSTGQYTFSIRAENLSGSDQKNITITVVSDLGNTRAVNFPSSTSRINFKNILNKAGNAQFSISVWFYIQNFDNNLNVIIGKYNANGNNLRGYCLAIDESIKKVLFFMLNNTTNGYIIRARSNLRLNTWYHVCITKAAFLGISNINMYINGVKETYDILLNTLNTNQTTSNDQLFIGNDESLTNGFLGNIDEVSYWNRELFENEVKLIYESERGLNLNNLSFTDALDAWWRMGDGDTGTTIVSSGPTTYNGTLQNGANFVNI